MPCYILQCFTRVDMVITHLRTAIAVGISIDAVKIIQTVQVNAFFHTTTFKNINNTV
jgi:hypothetical protein